MSTTSSLRALCRSFIVVGAGTGGFAVTVPLGRVGHQVREPERAREPRDAGHGITLWSNAIGVLRRLDCAQPALDVAGVLERGELRSSEGRVLVVTSVGVASRTLGEPSIALSGPELLTTLLSRLPLTAIELGRAAFGSVHRLERDWCACRTVASSARR